MNVKVQALFWEDEAEYWKVVRPIWADKYNYAER